MQQPLTSPVSGKPFLPTGKRWKLDKWSVRHIQLRGLKWKPGEWPFPQWLRHTPKSSGAKEKLPCPVDKGYRISLGFRSMKKCAYRNEVNWSKVLYAVVHKRDGILVLFKDMWKYSLHIKEEWPFTQFGMYVYFWRLLNNFIEALLELKLQAIFSSF